MKSYFNSRLRFGGDVTTFEGIPFSKKDLSPCSAVSVATGKCPAAVQELSLTEAKTEIKSIFAGQIQRCNDKGCINIPSPKAHGPRNSDDLLSNINIESVLQDWSKASSEKTDFYENGPVMHVPFEMCDFMNSNSSVLRDLDLTNLISRGYKSFCCVLNTDTWSGSGKHWVCIFALLNDNKCSIEYFNSSGRSADNYTYITKNGNQSAINDWVEHLKKNNPKFEIKVKSVVTRVLQYSETECGVWSLWYIKCRLEGYPPDFFVKSGVTDKGMLEYARVSLFV